MLMPYSDGGSIYIQDKEPSESLTSESPIMLAKNDCTDCPIEISLGKGLVDVQTGKVYY